MTIWIILMLCFFFTIWVLIKPDIMWSILAAVSWMLLMWYVLNNAVFALGDFGETALICICIGAATFVLLYTINDNSKKKRIEREKSERENPPQGTRETSDQYYDRLNRLTHPTKK